MHVISKYSRPWLLLAGFGLALLAPVEAAPPKPANHGANHGADVAAHAPYRAWIQEMRNADRGPFTRLRWFCKDGTILPPKPDDCTPHGGGMMHGEYTDHTLALREKGYLIANLLSELDPNEVRARPDALEIMGQFALEQFLIRVDDGWIYHKAQFYRGALNEEEERDAGKKLLWKLLADNVWVTERYLATRTLASYLPHQGSQQSAAKIRDSAAALVEKDKPFDPVRNKIHVLPDASDAQMVRDYIAKRRPKDPTEYERLAEAIDLFYAKSSFDALLQSITRKAASAGELPNIVSNALNRYNANRDAENRYKITAELLAAMRDHITTTVVPDVRLAILDLSLAVEAEHFIAATELKQGMGGASQQQQLGWLEASFLAAYGTGFLSLEEYQQARAGYAALDPQKVDATAFAASLEKVGQATQWATQVLERDFGRAVHTYKDLEPKADLFIANQLRASPLFFFADVMGKVKDSVQQDAGVQHTLFGQEVGTKLRSLNPGIAKGRLHVLGPKADTSRLDKDGIYVLPETVADLPPIAGILTLGEGNALSHIQLLARNLGIPNVVVDASLVPRLKSLEGTLIVLAVTPEGTVELKRADDKGAGAAVAAASASKKDQVLVTPDLQKLDLSVADFVLLSNLRAADAGRIAGPKAAKLGELAAHFPEAVAEGIVLPFGMFRALLNQKMAGTDLSVYDWMVRQYAHIRTLPPKSKEHDQAEEEVRANLERFLLQVEPGEPFRKSLRTSMEQIFGTEGTYGVHVRSDTNVEDLPGFTGAGLNLTVPNVVGFDNTMKALAQVWASPFTRRAFEWRQARMSAPEHVYPSILLMRTVPVEKSGVLVSRDIDNGDPAWISVAINEGMGGAVDGQKAEDARISLASGEVRLIRQAGHPTRRVALPTGGLQEVPVAGGRILKDAEAAQLVQLVRSLPSRYPPIVDGKGKPTAADIEFGFLDGKLRLFQLRPLNESRAARNSGYLRDLDKKNKTRKPGMAAAD
jgi:hypothetical protein